jgi:hypothetical protein
MSDNFHLFRDGQMISTGKWLELCEADAARRGSVATASEEEFSARVSKGSLAAPEEITVIRQEDGWRTHDLIYSPDADGNFAFQSMRTR